MSDSTPNIQTLLSEIRDSLARIETASLWRASWVTAEQAARMLGYEKETLVEKCAEGIIPARNLNDGKSRRKKKWMIRPSELDAHIDSTSRNAGAVRVEGLERAKHILASIESRRKKSA